MYESFYGLRAEPFRLSPDHRFCYEHSAYATARAYMVYALRRAEGFIMITGRPGTGKTTLIGELVEGLARENVTTANLVCTQLEADDLLKSVAYSFGVGYPGLDKAELLQRITVLLNRWHREKRRALLVVDEAQDLSISAMEELRLLTNIQVGGQPLLQIFLLGQPELRDLILSPQLEQVHQRIVAASHLEGLAASETEAYVVHRLQVVGWRGDPAIDRRIFPLIHKFSEGVPRRINLICSRLFLLGSVEERHEIGVDDVRVVIAELQAESLAAGSAFSDEEFVVTGEPDWVAVPGRDDAPDAGAPAVPLRAVSNESFAPAAPVQEPPANVETLAPVTPLKPPAPQSPRRKQSSGPPAAQEASSAPRAEQDGNDTAGAAPAARVHEPPAPPPEAASAAADELPERVANQVARAAPPRRSSIHPLLTLCIGLALGLSTLFFFELYVGRDDGWDDGWSDVPAGTVVPAPPVADPVAEEPIEELGILPSEQWERDGELIDWERDVEQAATDAGPEAPAVAPAPDPAGAPIASGDEAAARGAAAAPAPAEQVAATAADAAGVAAAAGGDRSASELSAAESRQLLALLNRASSPDTYTVSFDFDSIELGAAAREVLDRVREQMLAERGYSAEITGFSDYQGSEIYNMNLSLERAGAVRDYLVDGGVSRERLLVSGRGAQSGQEARPQQLRVVQISLVSDAD